MAVFTPSCSRQLPTSTSYYVPFCRSALGGARPRQSCRTEAQLLNAAPIQHALPSTLAPWAAAQPGAHTFSCRQRRSRLRAHAQDLEETVSDFGALNQKFQELAAEVKDLLAGTSIYLVGMMGSGKTTVGKLVASALQYPFLDADTLIETLAGSSVADIFAQDGEEEFRNLESQVLQELMPHKGVVVSTGGGAVVRQQNWGYMHHGVVVWLSGEPELLARRALRDGISSRPMLAQGGGTDEEDAYAATVAKVRRIMDTRRAKYAAADLHIPLENLPGKPGDVGAPPAVVAYRLLKAMADRLKQDASEREASSQFEIRGAGKLPPSMRVMQPATQHEE